jgi:hypothetical protein
MDEVPPRFSDSRIACCCSGDRFWKISIWSAVGVCATAGGATVDPKSTHAQIVASRRIRPVKLDLTIGVAF